MFCALHSLHSDSASAACCHYLSLHCIVFGWYFCLVIDTLLFRLKRWIWGNWTIQTFNSLFSYLNTFNVEWEKIVRCIKSNGWTKEPLEPNGYVCDCLHGDCSAFFLHFFFFLFFVRLFVVFVFICFIIFYSVLKFIFEGVRPVIYNNNNTIHSVTNKTKTWKRRRNV